ncbi:hypothetical protein D3C72_1309090 [compost metagenome]
MQAAAAIVLAILVQHRQIGGCGEIGRPEITVLLETPALLIGILFGKEITEGVEIRTRFALAAIVPVKLSAALLDQRQAITIHDDMMGADVPEIAVIGDAIEQLRREPVGSEIEPCFHIRVHAPQRLFQGSGTGAQVD